MTPHPSEQFEIRTAKPEEYEPLGRMTVDIYQALPGMPGPKEQPGYYAMLLDTAGRAVVPFVEIPVAVTPDGTLLGGVTFVGDMRYYNSGGSAPTVPNASGIRLLAVRDDTRNLGVGKALTRFCIQLARELGRSQVLLHTTRSMEIAWGMYERMGFQRFPEIDFSQRDLEVFGFFIALH